MSTEEQAIRAAGCLSGGRAAPSLPKPLCFTAIQVLRIGPRRRAQGSRMGGRWSGGVASRGRGEAAGQRCPEENNGMTESSRSCKTVFSLRIVCARKVFVRTPPRYLLSAQLTQIRFICAVKVK
jgi:hypothetical protein